MAQQVFVADVGQWDPEAAGPWELFVCRLDVDGADGRIINSQRIRSVLLGDCVSKEGPSAAEIERAVESINEGWTLVTPYEPGTSVWLTPGSGGTVRSALLGSLDADLDHYDHEDRIYVERVEALDAELGMRGWRLYEPEAEIITWVFPDSGSSNEIFEEVDGKVIEGRTSLTYLPPGDDDDDSLKQLHVTLVGAVELEGGIMLPAGTIAEWLPLVEGYRAGEDRSELDRMAIG